MRIAPFYVSTLLLVLVASGVQAVEPDQGRLIYLPPVAHGDITKIDMDRLTTRSIELLKQMHAETDPQDPQFGMIYETFDPERRLWVEGEGRDTMHHMMWTMVGLTNAYRAGGDPKVLNFLQEYPYAFYLRMMLGGEKFFGPDYGNGFCPYYWDDGDSVNITDYFRGKFGPDVRINGHSPMSSVHLAQDLALGHLDLWWLTGDPRLKQVTADLYQQVHYGKIAERFAARNYALNTLHAHPRKNLQEFRAAEAQGKEMLLKMPADQRRALYEKEFGLNYGPIITAAQKVINRDEKLPALGPAPHKPTDNLAWLRLRERKPGGIPAFPDDQAFDYYMALSKPSGDEIIQESFARWFTMWFLTQPLLNEYWMDDAPYQYGYGHFPGVGAAWNLKDGRYSTYHSQTPRHYWHTRSLHFSWLSAVALQMMDQWPEMHERYRREVAGSDPVIRFTDRTPQLDGRRDEEYSTIVDEGGTKISLASDPLSLFILVNGLGKHDMNVTVHETENESAHHATLQVAQDGSISVVNGEKQPLLHWSKTTADGVEIQIPYTVHRPQQDWLTAVEHGRHRIDVQIGRDGTTASRKVYFLSDARRIKDRLRATVEGSIVNHAKILDEKGWIPYAIPDKSRDDFSRLSFSGAYGHLIHTIAQYQLWKQNRRDWEVKRTVQATTP